MLTWDKFAICFSQLSSVQLPLTSVRVFNHFHLDLPVLGSEPTVNLSGMCLVTASCSPFLFIWYKIYVISLVICVSSVQFIFCSTAVLEAEYRITVLVPKHYSEISWWESLPHHVLRVEYVLSTTSIKPMTSRFALENALLRIHNFAVIRGPPYLRGSHIHTLTCIVISCYRIDCIASLYAHYFAPVWRDSAPPTICCCLSISLSIK